MRTAAVISIFLSLAGPEIARGFQKETFDDLARRADAARAHDQLQQAVSLYQKALHLKPTWADGWWSLGTIFYDADQYAGCAQAFTRFVALKPEVGPAQALLGLCEFEERKYDVALRHLFRAQELGFAGNEQIRNVALYHTALALIVTRNFEKAQEELAKLVAGAPATPLVRTAAGLAALRKPLLPSEIPEPDRALVVRMGEAMSAQLERRPNDASRLFEAILTDYPKAPEVHYVYGSILLNSNPTAGLALLKTELEISPQHVPALAAIAYEYLKEGNPSSALSYAERASHLAPADFAARVAYGRALLELGKISEAIQELEVAVQLAPSSPHARFALATAYSRAGRQEDAERERKEFSRLQKLIDSGRQ
jgi:tetratricopeptide (TPR) repeat protein